MVMSGGWQGSQHKSICVQRKENEIRCAQPESASHSAIFFSHNKSISAPAPAPVTIQRTGWWTSWSYGENQSIGISDDFQATVSHHPYHSCLFSFIFV
jgi:hypothetical protein